MSKRKVCVVTASRSEYGAARWIMRAVASTPGLQLQTLATGAHYSRVFGETAREITADGIAIDEAVDLGPDLETPGRLHHALALCLAGVGDALERLKPDIVVALGDRYELLPICAAAVASGIPLAHVSGGDTTEGAVDESIRHAVTKLSHLHFPAHEQAAKTLRGLGEAAERIHLVGEPSLEAFYRANRLGRGELAADLGLSPSNRWVLLSYHPVTLEPSSDWMPPLEAALSLLEEMEGVETLMTYPNSDPGNELIRETLERRQRAFPERFKLVKSLGHSRFVSFLGQAWVMVGNSSSALIEAPSARLAAINIGDRQKGRVRGGNVIDAAGDRASISSALEKAASPEFRSRLASVANPYGDGGAARRIAEVLEKVDLEGLRRKRVQIAEYRDGR